jgi:uncharacterized protein (TIRG00374 family)
MSHKRNIIPRGRDALQSIRISRVIFPVVVGLVVVAYLLYRQFDLEEFRRIEWEPMAWLWLILAVVCLVIRHLSYSARLHVLSEKAFSWKKCIELIFIWEFSSAVSPTSVGGSAVALFVLSREKLATAKTTAIVLYTVVLDSLFFIATLPALFVIFGPSMIRPELRYLRDLGGWSLTFVIAYVFMALYGAFFFYGLFIRPERGEWLLAGISRLRFLKRWREDLLNLGAGFVAASKELSARPLAFHFKAFFSTAVAWSMRFLLINMLIIAIVKGVEVGFFEQFKLFARLQTMFVILAFSPTPGGAGFHEYVFGDFLRDYIPVGIAVVVAISWRLLTYYSYLIAGAIVIPNWVRKMLKQRRQKKVAQGVTEAQ